MVKGRDLKNIDIAEEDKPVELKENTLMGKISGVIGKVLDCCRE